MSSGSDSQERAFVCDWVGEKFVGYSIHHVSGRFRVGGLRTQDAVSRAQALGAQRYLVDETTAVVRFIIPCGVVTPSQFGSSKSVSNQLDFPTSSEHKVEETRGKDLVQEAERIRWFFNQLFVQRITEVVAGEDEIWLLESGTRNELHIWRVRA